MVIKSIIRALFDPLCYPNELRKKSNKYKERWEKPYECT